MLGKATIVTPLYVSIVWILMISHQLLTETAVTTTISFINVIWPTIGSMLMPRIETIIFIYAFAWVFVLSSVIPSVILGKGRSVLIQFFVCLTLTFISLIIQDFLIINVNQPIEQIGIILTKFPPIPATAYLLFPFIFMFILDFRARKIVKRKDGIEKLTQTYLANTDLKRTTRKKSNL
jgi:hypothetical protein